MSAPNPGIASNFGKAHRPGGGQYLVLEAVAARMVAVRADLFRDQPVLTGELVRLEPLTETVLEEYLVGMADPQVHRLTATHAQFDRIQVEQWLATRAEQHDRADWAVLRRSDGAFLGEAVLNDFDPDNASANYRVWLAGPEAYGRGYGTEATRLVLDYAFGTAGLHRVSLGVLDFNPRARRVYEKCGFQLEGRLREAVRWDGEWHDELVMSVWHDPDWLSQEK